MWRWLRAVWEQWLGQKRSERQTPEEVVPPAEPPPSIAVLPKVPSEPVRPETASWERGPRLVIGLDFGTWATKVVVRRFDDPGTPAIVQTLEPPVPGYPWFASPSLVRENQGRFTFGGAALRGKSGTLHRSLKVRLLPPRGSDSDLLFDPAPFDGKGSPELCVAAYLGWALGRVRDSLDSRYGVGAYRPLVNIAAPMCHVGDEELRARYLRVVAAAWQAVFCVEGRPAAEELTLKEAMRRYGPWLDGSETVPGPGTRLYEVLPETVAPITSILEDEALDQGIYLCVDVGAGTTEVSVAHIDQPGDARRRIACYQDLSDILGGDDFERLGGRDSASGDYEERLARLVGEFTKRVRKVWALGWKKDTFATAKMKGLWKSTHVILSGGAAQQPLLEETIRAHSPWDIVHPWEQTRDYGVLWHRPSQRTVSVDGQGRARPGGREDFHMLAVASGLSFHRRDWPKWFAPDDVESLHPPEQTDKPIAGWWGER